MATTESQPILTRRDLPKPPATIYLIRHGEVVPEMREAYYGALDLPLGERGMEQSRALAERLAAVPFDAVYASDLSRAWTLAEMIAEPRDLPVRKLAAFRERNFGKFQGLTPAALEADHGDAYALWKSDRVRHRVEGAENFEDVHARVIPALEELVAAYRGQRVALVCHAGPIRVMLAHVLAMPMDHLYRIALNLCSISVVEFTEVGPLIKLING